MIVLDVHLPQGNLPVDGSLPSARPRTPQKDGWRRTQQKSKATVKKGDTHGKAVAVEENSAMEPLTTR